MDPDMNKYDLNHRVSHHGKMSDAEWEDAYRAAWARLLHRRAHLTILRRAPPTTAGSRTTLTSKLLVPSHDPVSRACIRWKAARAGSSSGETAAPA